ncbi:RecB family exonuclease [Candidatus Neomarinimicrobiota bacterium]
MIGRFSYSSLEAYQKCPVQFRIRYIDGVRKTDEGIEAFMGKRVHETLEFLYQERLNGSIPIIDRVIDFFHDRWEKKWHNRIAVVRKHLNPESFQYIGEDCIARYYRIYRPFNEQVIDTEMIIDFNLDNDENYPIRGIIDRLDRPTDSIWEIHDYKTGKNILSQAMADKNDQLALYQAGLIQNSKSEISINLVWHFLQKGIKIHSNRSEKQINTLINRTKSKIDKIRSKVERRDDFPARESALCNWCYYWDECPAKFSTNPHITGE